MSTVDSLVQDFMAQKKIAIVGVSDKRETGCNLAYRKFKKSGYQVYAINPRLTSFEGSPCYPNLKALPEKPDGVFILTSPTTAEDIVRQCVDLGVKRVWMHCMMGVKPGLGQNGTSVSPRAVEMCRAHGISVIPGSCPNQYLNPDFGHAMMRVLWRTLGFMKIQA